MPQENKMTESEWLTSTSFHDMAIGRSWSKASTRKARLFGCACCGRLGALLVDPRSREALELIENYAEHGRDADKAKAKQLARQPLKELGRPLEERARKHHGALLLAHDTEGTLDMDQALYWAADAVLTMTNKTIDDIFCATRRAALAMGFASGCTDERESSIQADLLRDVFGNPYRPVAVDPGWQAWKRRTLVKLSQNIYEKQKFDRLPKLAETLEKASCTEPDILAHCRGSTSHVRGCWVIDLLLGMV